MRWWHAKTQSYAVRCQACDLRDRLTHFVCIGSMRMKHTRGSASPFVRSATKWQSACRHAYRSKLSLTCRPRLEYAWRTLLVTTDQGTAGRSTCNTHGHVAQCIQLDLP